VEVVAVGSVRVFDAFCDLRCVDDESGRGPCAAILLGLTLFVCLCFKKINDNYSVQF
jgi:hypothetical protein